MAWQLPSTHSEPQARVLPATLEGHVIIIIPIVLRRGLRHREVKDSAWGHTQ